MKDDIHTLYHLTYLYDLGFASVPDPLSNNLIDFVQLLSSRTEVSSIRFSSAAQSCLTLCDPINRSMPGLPIHHQLPEFTQTHVH